MVSRDKDILKDIIEKIELDLRNSTKLWQTILDAMSQSIFLIDLNHKILQCNRATLDILEKSSYSEIIGHSCWELVHGTSGPIEWCPVKRMRQTGQKTATIQMIKDKWVEISADPVFNDQREITGAVHVITDISARKEAEVKLKASEEKYKNIINNLMDIIIILDLKGNFQYISPQVYEISGFKPEEIIGKNGFKLMHPDDIRKAAEVLKEALEHKKRIYIEYRTLHKDGYYIDVSASGRIVNIDGEDRIFAIVRNITDQKRAEQKLKESEENFRTIAEQAFMGILIIQDDKVEYINNALLQIFEYTYEDIHNWVKDDLLKIIHHDDLQFLREYRQKLRANDPNIKPYYSYRVFTKYGKLKWIDQFSKPITYRGKPAELVTIIDITEKKEAEQELIKLNSLKSELLRRTSHELKTPLVSIKGFSDLLLNVHKDKLDDYVLATVHEIRLGCERLENLIQDILKTSELESESVQLKKSAEDLSFLIKLCEKELQGLIRLRNHKINLKIHDKLMTSFEPEQIHLVISNLLNNAIKYTPPEGIIEVKSEIKDSFIIISIKDNGIGITTVEKERLFTQFGKIERYGQGLDIISDGSGLGLYISKKIVELHGGKIWVESEGRNKGTTFYFTLPLTTENKE